MTTSEEQSLTIESPDSSCPLLSNTDMKPITYKQSMAPQENNTMPYYYTYDSNKHKPIEHSPQKEGMLKETVQECQETIDKSTTTHKVFTSSTCTHPYITSPTPTVRPTTDPVLSHPGHLKGLSSPSAYKASFKVCTT